MDEVIANEDAERVSHDQTDGTMWYIPHHGVYHVQKLFITNKDTKIAEELEVEPEERSTLNFHFARHVRQQGHCQAESCELLL